MNNNDDDNGGDYKKKKNGGNMNSEDNTKEDDVGSSYNNKKDDRGINKGYMKFLGFCLIFWVAHLHLCKWVTTRRNRHNGPGWNEE